MNCNPELILIGAIVIAIFATLIYLIKQNKKIMASIEQFQAQLDRIDNSTNGIARELRDLKDQIKGAGLASDVEDAVLAKLTAAADKLDQTGKTDDAPVENAAE